MPAEPARSRSIRCRRATRAASRRASRSSPRSPRRSVSEAGSSGETSAQIRATWASRFSRTAARTSSSTLWRPAKTARKASAFASTKLISRSTPSTSHLSGGSVGSGAVSSNACAHSVAHDRREEVALVREVVVDQTARNAGLLRHLFDPDVVERTLGKQSRADLDQLLAPGFGCKAGPFLCFDADLTTPVHGSKRLQNAGF